MWVHSCGVGSTPAFDAPVLPVLALLPPFTQVIDAIDSQGGQQAGQDLDTAGIKAAESDRGDAAGQTGQTVGEGGVVTGGDGTPQFGADGEPTIGAGQLEDGEYHGGLDLDEQLAQSDKFKDQFKFDYDELGDRCVAVLTALGLGCAGFNLL